MGDLDGVSEPLPTPLAAALPAELPVPPEVHDRIMSLLQEHPSGGGEVVPIHGRQSRGRGRASAWIVGLAAACAAGMVASVVAATSTQRQESEAALAEAPAAAEATGVADAASAGDSPVFPSASDLLLAVPALLSGGATMTQLDPGCVSQLSQQSGVPAAAVVSQPITFQGRPSLLIALEEPAGTWRVWVVDPDCSAADPRILQFIKAPRLSR